MLSLGGNKTKKLHNQITEILDLLLKEGSITTEEVKQYYSKFLSK